MAQGGSAKAPRGAWADASPCLNVNEKTKYHSGGLGRCKVTLRQGLASAKAPPRGACVGQGPPGGRTLRPPKWLFVFLITLRQGLASAKAPRVAFCLIINIVRQGLALAKAPQGPRLQAPRGALANAPCQPTAYGTRPFYPDVVRNTFFKYFNSKKF